MKVLKFLGASITGALTFFAALIVIPESIIIIDDIRERFFPSLNDRKIIIDGQSIDFKGGVGRSPQNAIIITGAITTPTGIQAEYEWINKFYPRYKAFAHQTIKLDEQGKIYDKLIIATEHGITRELWFDITEFYGGSLKSSNHPGLDELLEIKQLIVIESFDTESPITSITIPEEVTIEDINHAKELLYEIREKKN